MVAYQVTGKTIIKDPTTCPHCFRTSEGFNSIVQEFGLRTMSDGTTRVQSWCKSCRGQTQGDGIQ